MPERAERHLTRREARAKITAENPDSVATEFAEVRDILDPETLIEVATQMRRRTPTPDKAMTPQDLATYTSIHAFADALQVVGTKRKNAQNPL